MAARHLPFALRRDVGQGTHAAVGVKHILGSQIGLGDKLVHLSQQVLQLRRVGGDAVGVLIELLVGGPDHVAITPRDHQDKAAIGAGFIIDHILGRPRKGIDDQVAALGPADMAAVAHLGLAQHQIDPGPGSIDHDRGLQDMAAAVQHVGEPHPRDAPAFLHKAVNHRPGMDMCPVGVRGQNDLGAQTLGPDHLPVHEDGRPAQAIGRHAGETLKRFGPRQDLVGDCAFIEGKNVIGQHRQSDHPRWPRVVFIKRHHQRHRFDQMRRKAEQQLPFAQGFTHQRHVALFQIAQAAMDQPTRPAGGAAADVFFFDQRHTQTARRRVASDPCPVAAGPDHDHIIDRVHGFALGV